MKKNIKVGEYWLVSYKCRDKNRRYNGIVLVKEDIDPELTSDLKRGWSCICARDFPWPWENSRYDCLFIEKDFLRKSSKIEFLEQRAEFLRKAWVKACRESDREYNLKKRKKAVKVL